MITLVNCILVVFWIFILVTTVAFLILLERKLLAASQRRIGPSTLGKRGFFQIIADVVKPLFKEIFEANFQALTLITLVVFILLFSQLVYSLFFQYGLTSCIYEDLEVILFIQSFFGGLSTFATFLIGYLSKTKYGILGVIRLIIIEVCTEVTTYMSNSMLSYAISALEYESILFGQVDCFMLGFLGLIFGVINLVHMFVSAQRAPLDMIENEGELVAGYNTEYSGPDVLVIYFAEYFHLFNAGLQFIFLLVGGYSLFGFDLSISNWVVEVLDREVFTWYMYEPNFDGGYREWMDTYKHYGWMENLNTLTCRCMLPDAIIYYWDHDPYVFYASDEV